MPRRITKIGSSNGNTVQSKEDDERTTQKSKIDSIDSAPQKQCEVIKASQSDSSDSDNSHDDALRNLSAEEENEEENDEELEEEAVVPQPENKKKEELETKKVEDDKRNTQYQPNKPLNSSRVKTTPRVYPPQHDNHAEAQLIQMRDNNARDNNTRDNNTRDNNTRDNNVRDNNVRDNNPREGYNSRPPMGKTYRRDQTTNYGGSPKSGSLNFSYREIMDSVGQKNLKDCDVESIIKYLIAVTHESSQHALSLVLKNTLTGMRNETTLPTVTLSSSSDPDRSNYYPPSSRGTRPYGGSRGRYAPRNFSNENY